MFFIISFILKLNPFETANWSPGVKNLFQNKPADFF